MTGGTKKLLLVEDEAIIALDERSMLERNGYAVVIAYRGEDAVEAVRTQPDIDLVLMDIDLGSGMDGTDAARAILAIRALPVVFLTSHSEKDYVDRVEEITRYGYVLKNAGEFVLLQSIRTAFELFEAHREARDFGARLEHLVREAPVGIYQVWSNGEFLHMNPELARMLGFDSPEEAIDYYSDIGTELYVDPQRRDEVLDILERHGTVRDFRFEAKRVDGTHFLLKSNVQVLERHPEKGMLISGFSVIDGPGRDAAQRRAEQQLRVARRALDSTEDIVVAVDREGRYLFVNRVFLERHHLNEERVIGRHAAEILGTELYEGRIKPLLDRALGGETVSFDMPMEYEGRGTRQVHVSYYPLRNGDVIDGVVSHIRDVTEAKRTEEELRSLNDEKDFLMKELYHRVRNNLSMITSLVNLKDAAAGDEVDLSDLRNQVRAVSIVHDQLRMHSGSPQTVCLAGYVDDLLAGVFDLSPQRPVAVELAIPNMHVGSRSAVTIGLVLTELATNAMKYGFREGDAARFSVRLVPLDDERCYRLTVSNSGNPFPDTVDPYRHETMGLGLVDTLVRQLNGTLEIRRSPTPVFTMTLFLNALAA